MCAMSGCDFGLRQFALFRQKFAEIFEDAIHVATALNEVVQLLATNDSDFRRVDTLLDVLIVREG